MASGTSFSTVYYTVLAIWVVYVSDVYKVSQEVLSVVTVYY